MRVVLDTNVCLDAFVFADPRVASLVAAMQSGAVEAVTREDCRAEWMAVLGYPVLRLDKAAQAAAAARFDGVVKVLGGAEAGLPVALDTPGAPELDRPVAPVGRHLPRCRDADDQKFLELAAAAGAAVLFSRDAEVLRLARRARRDGLFEIVKPEDWVFGGA